MVGIKADTHYKFLLDTKDNVKLTCLALDAGCHEGMEICLQSLIRFKQRIDRIRSLQFMQGEDYEMNLHLKYGESSASLLFEVKRQIMLMVTLIIIMVNNKVTSGLSGTVPVVLVCAAKQMTKVISENPTLDDLINNMDYDVHNNDIKSDESLLIIQKSLFEFTICHNNKYIDYIYNRNVNENTFKNISNNLNAIVQYETVCFLDYIIGESTLFDRRITDNVIIAVVLLLHDDNMYILKNLLNAIGYHKNNIELLITIYDMMLHYKPEFVVSRVLHINNDVIGEKTKSPYKYISYALNAIVYKNKKIINRAIWQMDDIIDKLLKKGNIKSIVHHGWTKKRVTCVVSLGPISVANIYDRVTIGERMQIWQSYHNKTGICNKLLGEKVIKAIIQTGRNWNQILHSNNTCFLDGNNNGKLILPEAPTVTMLKEAGSMFFLNIENDDIMIVNPNDCNTRSTFKNVMIARGSSKQEIVHVTEQDMMSVIKGICVENFSVVKRVGSSHDRKYYTVGLHHISSTISQGAVNKIDNSQNLDNKYDKTISIVYGHFGNKAKGKQTSQRILDDFESGDERNEICGPDIDTTEYCKEYICLHCNPKGELISMEEVIQTIRGPRHLNKLAPILMALAHKADDNGSQDKIIHKICAEMMIKGYEEIIAIRMSEEDANSDTTDDEEYLRKTPVCGTDITIAVKHHNQDAHNYDDFTGVCRCEICNGSLHNCHLCQIQYSKELIASRLTYGDESETEYDDLDYNETVQQEANTQTLMKKIDNPKNIKIIKNFAKLNFDLLY
jgi:hypothetical protein